MLSGSSKLIFSKGSLSGLKPSFYAFLSDLCSLTPSISRMVYLMPRLVQTSTAKGHSLKTCSVSQDSRSIVCS
ncbi:hypothetical protein ES288_D03G058100v1 [Gossypium darwinii]|uniref:Uncharacterized protein n=1 Tax=Gossypium darwinii TaxID=34276 RepID=A0A5D2D5H4_GOSDA|nr:hypothetical protein ES288_D03G058100v1 [Gossypium darwinii]